MGVWIVLTESDSWTGFRLVGDPKPEGLGEFLAAGVYGYLSSLCCDTFQICNCGERITGPNRYTNR